MIVSHIFTEEAIEQLITDAVVKKAPELSKGTWKCAISWDGEDRTFTFTAKDKKQTFTKETPNER